ncbi:hypothetical protein [Rhizobium sp. G21]|uniref:hypothetical protein n=1 Tax=Rhizobium sp. G21 TaxID=2758439 RepID=UPI001FF05433|nr:hypothetical protein [Rhizobium sp. G21]
MPVGEADKFGAEAEGKGEDADAAPAPDEIVTHLMHEDDQRDHDEKGDDISEQRREEIGDHDHWACASLQRVAHT